MKPLLSLLLLAPAGLLRAEPALRVFSEFSRIGRDGAVVAPDRGPRGPREILSPLVPRNGWASFHVVVSGDPGTSYELQAGQNPENAVRIVAYQEIYEKAGEAWIPDSLKPVTLPAAGRIPDDAKAVVYWLDIFTSALAPVRRIKVEPQIWVNGRWLIYPMEVRVGEVRVPRLPGVPAALPGVDAPADRAAWTAVAAVLCTPPTASKAAGDPTVRSLIRRNALQDIAILKAVPEATRTKALTFAGGCSGTPPRDEYGAEWYLRFRDILLRSGLQP